MPALIDAVGHIRFVNAVVGADFLSEPQKADILGHNAARFPRLSAALCVRSIDG